MKGAAAWPNVQLATVLKPVDRSVATAELEEVYLAGVYSFGRGLFRRGPIAPAATSYTRYNRLVTDDFVISQPKAWEGALARVSEEFDGWFLSPVFPTFQADRDQLEPSYLEWFCKQRQVWEELHQKSQGIGARRESVSAVQFLSLKIPLPPLDEQRRIVRRIEEFAAKIELARTLRLESTAGTEALYRAAIDTVYHRFAAESGTVPLGNVCKAITDGDHNTPVFSDAGVKFIFVGNVASGYLHFNSCKWVDTEYFQSLRPARIPEPGDILYSAVGATLGLPALVETEEPFCFQRHIAILKPDRERLDPRFAWNMLRSRTVFRAAWASTTGSAQPTIPLNAIRELRIPLPSVSAQRAAVEYFQGIERLTSSVSVGQNAAAADLQALLPAILDRAFKGEL